MRRLNNGGHLPSVPKPTKKPKRNLKVLWAVERGKWLELHPTCQASEYGLSTACGGPLQVHHRTPRGSGGSREALPLMTVCFTHHVWIEANREEARTLGLLVRRATF